MSATSIQLQDLLPELCTGLAPVDLPLAWHAHAAERPGGAVRMHYERHRGPLGMDLRFMRLWSAKVEVQTLFVYPAPASAHPVLAAETVWLGSKPQILVLDTPCLAPTLEAGWTSAMQQLLQQHHLQNSADTPAWYADCRSGHDVFLRPSERVASQLPLQPAQFDVPQQFGRYAQAVVAHCQRAWAEPANLDTTQQAAHQRALSDYRRHHHQHSPGVPLMSRCFGVAWTVDFMTAFFG